MIATLDGEVGFDPASFFESHIRPDNAVQLGLEMSIRKKKKSERLTLRRQRTKCSRCHRCGQPSGSKQ